MSNLKRDIGQILKFWRSNNFKDTYYPLDEIEHYISTHYISKDLIESVLPEEIDVKSKYETGDDGGINVTVDENNAALKDIKSKLIDTPNKDKDK